MFAAKMKSRDVLSDCLKEQSASAHEEHLAHMLQKLVLIQQGILISIFFASLLSFIVGERIFKENRARKSIEDDNNGVALQRNSIK